MRKAVRCLLILLMALTAGLVRADEQQTRIERGAQLVQGRCVLCHSEKSLPKLVELCSSRHGEDFLDDFLKRHYVPDDQARLDIIAYLTCDPNRQPK